MEYFLKMSRVQGKENRGKDREEVRERRQGNFPALKG